MALSKIRQANKKWKHQQRRLKRRRQIEQATTNNKIIKQRSRKLFLQGQREAKLKRQKDLDYVEETQRKILDQPEAAFENE